MRGRVTAGFFSLSILLSGSLFAVCDFQLQHSTPLRASYLDISIDGNDLWAATGLGVQLFDRSVDPPRLTATLALPGLTRSIRAANGIAYAASGRTLHVIRKNGTSIERVSSIDAGGAVNDLLITGSTLIAAVTSSLSLNAVIPWSLANPLAPAPLPALPASSGSALSLAASGSLLFAADGDNSVEVFSALSPSRVLTTSLVRASAVSISASRLHVSDGQQTEVFVVGSSITSLGVVPIGIVSLAPVAGDIVLIAGNDRGYRVIDLSVPGNPIELFGGDVAPTGGSINRIGAIENAGARFYIAGGDGGLLTFDATSFAPPFPLRSYPLGAVASTASSTTAIYAAQAAGGIAELSRSPSSGSLTLSRSWASGITHHVHESADDFLLSSSGAMLTFWTLRSTTPAAISTSAFRAAIRSAEFVGTTAYVLLDDGSVWTADLVQAVPAPVQVIASGIAHLAATSQGVTVTEIGADGSTEARFYARGNFASAASVSLQGAATALAASGSTAAVFTFRGTHLIDFPAGSTTLIAGSASRLVTGMAITGTNLVDISSNGIRVWNLQSGLLLQELLSPSEPVAVSAAPGSAYAAVATFNGVTSVKLDTASRQPRLLATIGGNEYQRKAAASARFLYLFDGQSIDVYDIVFSGAPRFVTTISVPGSIDIAASDDGVFTLGSVGAISIYSPAGVLLRTGTISEGSDVLPLAIFSVRDAPWVAIRKGCQTTDCDTQTLVYDPASLVRSAVISGGAIGVTAAGSSAWALFDGPAEIRVYDTTDPLHPVQRASRAREQSSVALAQNENLVYALGSTLLAYDALTLTPAGAQLSAESPSGATKFAIFEGCGIIAGRSGGPLKYTINSGLWTAAGPFPLSGNVRTFTQSAGKLFVLSDYALDIWGSSPGPRPAKRRATR
ncbi:MAG: hypothetical protein JJE51_13470 [Thermoanaerobaculia bacterium]|nr:hypothetical protein [Thermoanaerobaculia bacterium]